MLGNWALDKDGTDKSTSQGSGESNVARVWVPEFRSGGHDGCPIGQCVVSSICIILGNQETSGWLQPLGTTDYSYERVGGSDQII